MRDSSATGDVNRSNIVSGSESRMTCIKLPTTGGGRESPKNPNFGAQLQTVANAEQYITMAPGTYNLSIPLLAIGNPISGQ